jgi:hypothetical protein
MQLTGFLHFNNIPTKEQFKIRSDLSISKAVYSLTQQPMSVSYFVTFTINRNCVGLESGQKHSLMAEKKQWTFMAKGTIK